MKNEHREFVLSEGMMDEQENTEEGYDAREQQQAIEETKKEVLFKPQNKAAASSSSSRISLKHFSRLHLGAPSKKDLRLLDLKKEVQLDDHLITLDQLYERYHTNPETGLTSEQAENNLTRDGFNQLNQAKGTPEYIKFLKHMFYGFAMILWLGAVFSFSAYIIEKLTHEDEADKSHLYLGSILLIVVLVSGVFSYFQDRSSSKIMQSFQKLVPDQATVLRDGKVVSLDVKLLTKGDVVVLKSGDKVPADIRIIEASGLKVDNSSLTGETEPQRKTTSSSHDNPLETQNLAFYSTAIMEGTGKGVVYQIGGQTVIGRLADLTTGLKKVNSPITREINHFVRMITGVSVAFAMTFFIAALVLGFSFIQSVIYFIAMMVANVPEGLLVTVTLCLTLTAKKMANKNCLIKSLASVETLGSTSTICSDKTGTLTQNRMTVTSIVYNNTIFPVKYSPDKNKTMDNKFDLRSPEFKALSKCARLCSRAEFVEDSTLPVLQRPVNGDASEAGILKCMECIFENVASYRHANIKLAEIPFNSTNKYQLSIHYTENKNLLVMKGAPEKILEICSTLAFKGSNITLSAAIRETIEGILHTLGSRGERVLGFADIDLPGNASTEFNIEKPNFPTTGLRFLGLMSLIDPPRETVPDAVEKCRSAGIRVIMVTGDHPVTAEAIARKVGIITSMTRHDLAKKLKVDPSSVPDNMVRTVVVTGDQLREMSEKDLDLLLQNHSEIVFARTTPTQKLMIVEGCQRLGFITAVTGDGVNDSPALKKADIGIAMGISGSDVSKQAADMILLDDNFASIVTGVEEGRLIFDNLKKSITYVLTSNIPEMSPFMAYIILGFPMPLSIIAILIVDVGTDMLPAVALAYEPPESDIMKRPPRNPFYDKLVNRRLIWMAYGQIGIIQTMAGFCSYFTVMADYGFLPKTLFAIRKEWDNKMIDDVEDSFGQQWTYNARKALEHYSHSAFFAAIIVTQLADGIICKTRKNSIFRQGMRNHVLNGGLLFAIVLGCFILYTPGMYDILSLPALKLKHWLPGIPFAVLIFIFDETRRLIIRRRPGGWVERETYY